MFVLLADYFVQLTYKRSRRSEYRLQKHLNILTKQFVISTDLVENVKPVNGMYDNFGLPKASLVCLSASLCDGNKLKRIECLTDEDCSIINVLNMVDRTSEIIIPSRYEKNFEKFMSTQGWNIQIPEVKTMCEKHHSDYRSVQEFIDSFNMIGNDMKEHLPIIDKLGLDLQTTKDDLKKEKMKNKNLQTKLAEMENKLESIIKEVNSLKLTTPMIEL